MAVKAAKAAGDLLVSGIQSPLSISYKGERNIVTEMDKKAEALIVNMIEEAFPDHEVIAEEGGGKRQEGIKDPWRWYVDPLDGTTNYAHQFPIFCVSIGLEKAGSLIVGVVYQPLLNEMFVAQKGKGAFLNGKKLQVSTVSNMEESLLATGFPYEVKKDLELHLARFKGFMLNSLAIRRAGSAAIDLCYVAAGRFDGFWESHLKPWDMAAGVLMVTEAGGKVTDIDGGGRFLSNGEIIASNGKIHGTMYEILEEAHRKRELA